MILGRENSYGISYEEAVPEGAKVIVVAMHGFCGDKKSSCINALETQMNEMGIGLVKFDWPAHGASEVEGEEFRVENCLADLEAMVQYVHAKYPRAKLVAFGTSFGGYATLLYAHGHKEVFSRIILRSPAINMYRLMNENMIDAQRRRQLEEDGYFQYGFERMLKVTDDFVKDLAKNNVSEIYGDEVWKNITIIHGTADDLVPFADSEGFAKKHACKLYPVQGADHRYKKPGELDQVINLASRVVAEVQSNNSPKSDN